MDIFYGIDSNYIVPFKNSISTLIENGNIGNTKISVLCLDQISFDFVLNLNLNYNNITPILFKQDLSKFIVKGPKHLNNSVYTIIFVPFYSKDEYSLWLDADTLIVGDISELLNIKIYFKIAGVNEGNGNLAKYAKSAAGLKENLIYINTGVSIINNKVWKDINWLEELSKIKSKVLHDQVLVNHVFIDSEKHILEEKYNYMPMHFGEIYSPVNKSIIHFLGPNKPWDNSSNCHEISKFIYDYFT